MPDSQSKSQHFSRLQRLTRKDDFARVFAKPKKVSSPCFVVLYRKNDLGYSRLGITISKRSVRQSVDRNRIRRIIRESFRHHKELLKELDIVLVMRSECTPLTKSALKHVVDNLWQKLTASSSPA